MNMLKTNNQTQLNENLIPVTILETEEVQYWSLPDVLDAINRDRCEGWEDYHSGDWVEGWKEWVRPEGFYHINSNNLTLDYFAIATS